MAPRPKLTRERVRRLFERSNELNRTRLQTGPQIYTDASFGRIFGVGAAFHQPKEKQSFHQFLFNHLIHILSENWYYAELKKLQREWHPLIRWVNGGDEYLKTASPKAVYGQLHSFHPDGNMQALMTLADDVYQLAHVLQTPDKPILRRLRDSRSFQGARYEVFTASLLARCGCRVEFIENKSKKTPDILAVCNDGSWSLVAEAKSRHRSAVPNKVEGQVLQADVGRLIREAMQQNVGTMPFLIFVDVNLPFSTERPVPWLKEVHEFINAEGRKRPGYELLSGLIATNYSWHYEGARPSSNPETLFIPNSAAKYALPKHFHDSLTRSLQEYGCIPDDEVRKIKLNERFPDLPPLS